MATTKEQFAEMTPREHAILARDLYQGQPDLAGHGVGHVFIYFPDMLSAAMWAADLGISRHVRLFRQHSEPGMFAGFMTEPVTVIYQF